MTLRLSIRRSRVLLCILGLAVLVATSSLTTSVCTTCGMRRTSVCVFSIPVWRDYQHTSESEFVSGVLQYDCGHQRWHRESTSFVWGIFDSLAINNVPLLWPRVLQGVKSLAEDHPDKAGEVVQLLGQEPSRQRSLARACMTVLGIAQGPGGSDSAFAAALVSLVDGIGYGLRPVTSEDLVRAERVAEQFPMVRTHLLPELRAYADSLSTDTDCNSTDGRRGAKP